MIERIKEIYYALFNQVLEIDGDSIFKKQFYFYLLFFYHPLLNEQFTIGKNKYKPSVISSIVIKKFTNYKELTTQNHYDESFIILENILKGHEKEIYKNKIYELLNNFHEDKFKVFIFDLLLELVLRDKIITTEEKSYMINLEEKLGLNILKDDYDYFFEDGDTKLGFNFSLKFKESLPLRIGIGTAISLVFSFVGFLFSFLVIYFLKANKLEEFTKPPIDEYIAIGSSIMFFLISFIYVITRHKEKYILKGYRNLIYILLATLLIVGCSFLIIK